VVGRRRATRIGWAQKNRFGNRSGEQVRNQENERVNRRNDLPVVSQDGFQTGPTLHQGALIGVKHDAKIPNDFTVTKQPEYFFLSLKCVFVHLQQQARLLPTKYCTIYYFEYQYFTRKYYADTILSIVLFLLCSNSLISALQV